MGRLDRAQRNPGPWDRLRVPVNVIVPVYRDLPRTRRCVESVLESLDHRYAKVILVDDASPEPALSGFCEHLAGAGTVSLLRNERNLGFVASVNRGMQEDPDRDVVLLNSDTEVPVGWLERLQRCALQAEDIATVTPFSNNATICSYPLCCEPSKLPEGVDLAAMDRLFALANAGLSVDLPTAVGFCMYIGRRCLSQIGDFDAERFGLGYGEENDFSLRARGAGWRNVLCADLFVYHHGAVSFGTERFDLMKQGETLLVERYPHYPAQVARFVMEDPLRVFRDAVDRLRLDMPGQAHLVVGDLCHSRDKAQAFARQITDSAERARLENATLLHEARTAFARTDEALRNVESRYEGLLAEARADFSRTDEALSAAQQAVAHYEQNLRWAMDELDRIKSSRLWRYSRWLRKLLDNS